MNTAKWFLMLVLAGGVAFTGCGKKEAPAPTVADGVTLDIPKLREAFATANPDLQTCVSEVAQGVRYGDYARAFAGMDKLSKASGLTDAQKKIVAEVTDQLKAAAAKAPAAPR